MATALSPHNRRLDRVHDLLSARGRREQDRFAFEGETLLDEALASNLEIFECYATDAAAAQAHELLARVEHRGVELYLIPEKALARLSDLETPPGIITVAAAPEAEVAPLLAREGPVVLLAGVNDPGNAGTLVRAAEAFGAAGVLFGAGGVDPLAPKTVRAAMGSLFRLPIARISPDTIVAEAASAHRPLVALALEGEALARAQIDPRAIIAVGNERHGVARWLPHWDRAVRIEQVGPTDSLNAAVAGAVVLYALLQRR